MIVASIMINVVSGHRHQQGLDLNLKFVILLVVVEPEQQASDHCCPLRTSARKNLCRYIRQRGHKECRNICHKPCQNWCQIECRENLRKYVRIDVSQNARKNVRIYGRKNVRYNVRRKMPYTSQMVYKKLCQNIVARWGSLEESSSCLMCLGCTIFAILDCAGSVPVCFQVRCRWDMKTFRGTSVQRYIYFQMARERIHSKGMLKFPCSPPVPLCPCSPPVPLFPCSPPAPLIWTPKGWFLPASLPCCPCSRPYIYIYTYCLKNILLLSALPSCIVGDTSIGGDSATLLAPAWLRRGFGSGRGHK